MPKSRKSEEEPEYNLLEGVRKYNLLEGIQAAETPTERHAAELPLGTPMITTQPPESLAAPGMPLPGPSAEEITQPLTTATEGPPSFFSRVLAGYGAGMLKQAELQQETSRAVIGSGLKVMKVIDKPYNAVRVAAHRVASQQPGVFKPGTLEMFIKPKEKEPLLTGLIDGWNQEEIKSWADVRNVVALGPEGEQRLNRWVDRSKALRVMRGFDHFVTDLVVEGLIDTAIFGGVVVAPAVLAGKKLPIVTRGLARLSPKWYTRVYWNKMQMPAKSAIRRGFTIPGGYVEQMVKKNTPYVGVDDIIMAQMGQKIPPGGKLYLFGKAGEVAGEITKEPLPRLMPTKPTITKEVAQSLTANINDAALSLKTAQDNLAGAIDELSAMRVSLDDAMAANAWQPDLAYVNQLQDDMFFAETKKNMLEDRIAQSRIDLDAAISRRDSVEALDVDYMAASRALREKYISDYIKVSATPQATRENVQKVTEMISFGRTSNLEELADDEFWAMFDFLDVMKADPDSFGKLPGWLKDIHTISGADWMTPSWMYFRRHGVEKLWGYVDAAYIDKTRFTYRAIEDWEGQLAVIGRDDQAMRRVFLYADGRRTEFDEAVMAAGISAERRAAEEAAGDYIKEIADELRDRAVAQREIGVPGKPVVKEHYITHLFERVLDEATATPDDAWRMNQILDIYEKRANIKIDIPMFKKRLGARDKLIENADTAFRAMVGYESWQLYMEPALKRAAMMARLTGNDRIIDYTTKWINYAVRGMPTRTEAATESSFRWVGKNILERGTKWLPEGWRFRSKDRATKQILGGWRRLTYAGAMSFNPSPVMTNSTQVLLNTSAIGYTATLRGYESVVTKAGRDILDKHCRVLVGRVPMETFDISALNKFERAGSAMFRWVDRVPNIGTAFNGTLYKLIAKDKQKLDVIRKFGDFQSTKRSVKFWAALDKALDAGHFKKELEIANFVTRLNQYSYRSFDMPRYMWGTWGKALGQFTTWPANYFYSYLPEMSKWMFTGEAPWGRLGAWERQTLMRHILQAEVLIQTGKNMGVDLTKHRPIETSKYPPFLFPGGASPSANPIMNVIAGTARYFTAEGNDTERSRALWQMKRGAAFVPPVLIDKMIRIYGGETPLVLFARPLREQGKKPSKPTRRGKPRR